MRLIRAAAIAACASTAAHADIVTYSNWNTLDDVSGTMFQLFNAPARSGIVFEAATSGDVSSVAVPLAIIGSVQRTVTAEIWTVDEHFIPQTVIATGSQTISGLPDFASFRVDIDFMFQAAIEAGQMYALALHVNGSSTGVHWHGSTLDPQGMVTARLPGDIWRVKSVAEAGGMPAAQIFVTPAPGTLALFGLAGLAARRRR